MVLTILKSQTGTRRGAGIVSKTSQFIFSGTPPRNEMLLRNIVPYLVTQLHLHSVTVTDKERLLKVPHDVSGAG